MSEEIYTYEQAVDLVKDTGSGKIYGLERFILSSEGYKTPDLDGISDYSRLDEDVARREALKFLEAYGSDPAERFAIVTD